MNLFPYTGPMTSADIFADVYRRSARSLSCSDRMCGADDCETCRGPQQESDDQQQEDEQNGMEENK